MVVLLQPSQVAIPAPGRGVFIIEVLGGGAARSQGETGLHLSPWHDQMSLYMRGSNRIDPVAQWGGALAQSKGA
jgi:hypothetical protein